LFSDIKRRGPTPGALPENSEAMTRVIAQTALDQFSEAASAFGEVMECYNLSGEFDLLLKVVALPNIGQVHSSFVLSTGKVAMAYPLMAAAVKRRAEK
jgi:DNA-binding Lrp family transcriptional regulator